jgi:hypothetical protein
MYTAAIAFGAVIVVMVEAGERYCCCHAGRFDRDLLLLPL